METNHNQTNNNQRSFLEILISLIQSSFKTFKEMTQLAGLETKLAKKTLVNILILSSIIKIFTLTTWLSFCGVIGLYLMSLGFSALFTLSIICLLNFLVVLAIAITILRIKAYLFFPATRRQLQLMHHPISLDKDFNNEKPSLENKTS